MKTFTVFNLASDAEYAFSVDVSPVSALLIAYYSENGLDPVGIIHDMDDIERQRIALELGMTIGKWTLFLSDLAVRRFPKYS